MPIYQAVQSLTDAVHVLLQSVPLPHDRKESIQLLIGDVRAELAKIAPPVVTPPAAEEGGAGDRV